MFMFSNMRFEIIVFVLSAYCLSTVFTRMPPWKPDRFCKSGVVGPACSSDYYSSELPPCKPGYTCKGGFCCRDPVCPKGWIEGGSCNLLPGQTRCPHQYQCINSFCCKERESAVCPQFMSPRECPVNKVPSQYQTNADCRQGICCPGPCGMNFCIGNFPRPPDRDDTDS